MEMEREAIAWRVCRYASLDSTNREAVRLAERGAPEGTVVVARAQTAGRGRRKRVWRSPEGGLWMSVLFRPSVDPACGAQLTVVAAVAVAEALQRAAGVACGIKWPNDILTARGKLCGILSEMTLDEDGIAHAIVGIGVNVNATRATLGNELSKIASSLYLETGRFWKEEEIQEAIQDFLGRWYAVWQKEGFEKVREAWLRKSCTIGKSVRVLDDGREIFAGRALDMDACGALVIRAAGGELRRFDFGEISLRDETGGSNCEEA